MVEIAVGRVEGRAAMVLVMLSERLGVRATGGTRWRMPLSRQEFAEWIGSAGETLSRVIGRLKRQGLVAEARGRLLPTSQ